MSFKYKVLGNVGFGDEINSILKAKGITDINAFLNPTKKHVESELLFDNIDLARDKFVFHLNNNSKILIIVDTDTDGYTSAALMYQYIKRIKPSITINYIIHDGKQHGLDDLLPKIYGSDYNLIIIPDAGSNDYVECTELYMNNKEIIILDHHIVSKIEKEKPLSYHEGHFAKENPAIIVNNQSSNRVTDKSMTGVGITYKFCKLLDAYFRVNYADDYLDLVAIGMIADRADLFNLQSRYLVLEGLNRISNRANKNIFISILINAQSYSMNNKVTFTGLSFYVIPLINSLIRLGEFEEKKIMFEALCNSDRTLVRKVRGKGEVTLSIQEYSLKSCQSTNRKQRKLTEESVVALSEDIDNNNLNKFPILICNAREDVDSNSTGLIANKLASTYQRPCLLMRRYNNVCVGSGRGYDKCEILDFNKWCKETGLFSMVEGHENAFGCRIKFENTYKLFDLISKMESIDEPIYHVYGVYNDKTLSDQTIKRIAKYDYLWSAGVDEPIFLIENITSNKYNINLIGSKQNRIEFVYHNIKFTMFSKGHSLSELYRDIINTGDNIKFTIVGRFNMDGKEPQVMIEDMIFEKSDVQIGFGF